ncbi:hypothetical protein O181_083971 [Austropuccinia psidii MF-1]|uniref:Uncharacterized protein n=1 Tax=Austropuccinia psidii MF-1 TaxID=1389203 RepID=A0A9Q3IID8_9BASI|nr:hypothetical protein [Austropuccinia psidii MF-1]
MLTGLHHPPSPSSPLLTLSHPCPYHLYAHVVPSQHAFNTASHPYACVVPSRHVPDTAYHPRARRECTPNTTYPYAYVVPSQHAPYAHGVPSRHCLPSLRSRSALLTCSQHCLPSLRSRGALPTSSRHHLSLCLCSALPTLLTILTLAECAPGMLPTPLILIFV